MMTTKPTTLTPEQRKRVLSSLTETCRLLEKEMAYEPKNRKQDVIRGYEEHIAKLEAMLDGR